MLRRRAIVLTVTALLAMGVFGWAQGGSMPANSQANAAQPSISGTIAYRERIALPPDAAIEVKLQDVSAASGMANTVAETVFAPGGKQVPIPFQLSYNPADIKPAHKYQVEANIRVKGKLMFSTTVPYPVITQGAPTQVAMMLQQAAAKPATAPGRKLTDTTWKLVEVNSKPAIAVEGTEAHLFLERKGGAFSGSTGCNQMRGSYIASEGALQFTPGALTMKMCPPPVMEQERAVLAAIKATTNYRIDGDALELLNGTQPLAQFRANPKP